MLTGQQHNDDLGLIYYNARYYLPGVGRFLSADTIVPSPTRPQLLNRYSYVENRPLSLVDPSGHFSEEAIIDYLTQNYGDDAQYMLEQWKSNQALWELLRYAEGGDIAFVGYSANFMAGGLYYRFDGIGQDYLMDITISNIMGDTPNIEDMVANPAFSSTYWDTSIDDLFAGRNNLDWGGLIRWITLQHDAAGLEQTIPQIKPRNDLVLKEGDFELGLIASIIVDQIDILDKTLLFVSPSGRANKWMSVTGAWNYGFYFTFEFTGLDGPIDSAKWINVTSKYATPSEVGFPYPGSPVYGYFPH